MSHDRFVTVIAVVIGIVLGQSLPSAHADGSLADPINRIAKSLESIDSSLKSIDKKMK